MSNAMAWALVFHILGFVFWVAGLLVAAQVLALHAQEPSQEARETLTNLESRLLNGVAHPGALLTIVTGVILVTLAPEYLHQNWLRAKILLVAVLIVLDLVAYFRARALHAGKFAIERRWCKIMHGAISLVFIGILVLVIIKPF